MDPDEKGVPELGKDISELYYVTIHIIAKQVMFIEELVILTLLQSYII